MMVERASEVHEQVSGVIDRVAERLPTSFPKELSSSIFEGMKGINTSGQELNSGGVASFSAPRDGVSHLAFPALAPLGNDENS
jgi:hypothetical protein